MRPTISNFIFLLFIFFLISCKKDLKEDEAQFVGVWRTNNATFDIKTDGSCYYGKGGTGGEERIHGRIKKKNNTLIIKGSLRKEFSIDESPHLLQASATEYNTVMTLSGEIFYKLPKISVDPAWRCFNGIKDGDETNVDCGGSCNSCDNCADHIMNQDETGIDCGGTCLPCEIGLCESILPSNTATLQNCPSNTLTLQESFTYGNPSMFANITSYKIMFNINNCAITLAFPKKPTGSLVYNLDPSWNIDETDPYNAASVEIRKPGSSFYDYSYPTSGKIYVTVTDFNITASFCDIEFNSQFYGCFKSSAKFIW